MLTALLLIFGLIAIAYAVSIPRGEGEYTRRRWGQTPHEHALDNPALQKARDSNQPGKQS